MPTRHSGLKKLWEKLYRLRQYLGWWNKKVFGNLFHKLQEEEKRVILVDQVYQADSIDQNIAKIRKASTDYQNLLNVEESYWKQQAHCKWITEGDSNTKLFHNMVKRKRLKRKTQCIE